jgi:hypothetical protein
LSSVIEQSAISTSNGAKDVIAIGGTLAWFGSCSREPPDVFMLLLQMFLGTMAVTTTVLTAAVSERQLVQDELHRSEWELTDFFESAAVGIHAMALIYKSLYQSYNMANLGAGDYLRRLSQLLFEVYHLADGRITLKLDLETVAGDLTERFRADCYSMSCSPTV